ncbi:hypothetical protein JW898_05965 [Candidatus Woesearchaeota archaeon]|nr:hypothetical protein [Candidatus Woesearchaeota archaeon]
MTDGVGSREAETLERILAKIRTSMPQRTEEEMEFSNLVSAWYETLQEIHDTSDGHGITLVVWNGERGGEGSFEDYLREARPYNGVPHRQSDADIVSVMSARRHRDAALVSGKYGEIMGANVPLPLDPIEMRKAYGILPQYQVADFMGCAKDEDLGTRAASALCATNRFDEIAIITLGENTEAGKKGPLRVYYGGNIVYSTDGKELRWECARAEARPDYGNVIPLDRYKHDVPEHHRGKGQYDQPTQVAAAGRV